MKKATSTLLLLVLLLSTIFSFTACMSAEKAAFVGKWYAISSVGNISEDEFYLFNKDGTGSTPQSTAFNWEYDAERDQCIMTIPSNSTVIPATSAIIPISNDKQVVKIGNSYYTKGDINSQLPEHTVTSSGSTFQSSGFSNKSVTCRFSVDINSIGSYATINGERMNALSQTVSADGDYEFIVYNSTGELSESVTFTIKTSLPAAPTFSIEPTNYINNRSYTNKNISLSWTEDDVTATLNNQSYTKNSIISAEGDYTFVLTDKAGNSTTIYFVIDKTPPEIYFKYTSFVGIALPDVFGTDVQLELDDWYPSRGYVFRVVGSESYTAYYEDGTELTTNTRLKEGSHTITIYDIAGNSAEYRYTYE